MLPAIEPICYVLTAFWLPFEPEGEGYLPFANDIKHSCIIRYPSRGYLIQQFIHTHIHFT